MSRSNFSPRKNYDRLYKWIMDMVLMRSAKRKKQVWTREHLKMCVTRKIKDNKVVLVMRETIIVVSNCAYWFSTFLSLFLCARWIIGDWSSCASVSAVNSDCGEGFKTRTVHCQQRVSPTLTMRVAEGACLQQRPESRVSCQLRPCNHWRTSEWSQVCLFGTHARFFFMFLFV